MGFFCKVFASLVLLFRGIFRLGSIFLLSTIFLFGSIFLLSVAAFDPVHCIPNNPFCSPPGARPTGFVGEISASGNASIDWKETWAAHVFKVDLPELNKGEVKVEVEQGRILRIRGVRCKEEEKIDKRYCVAWSERFLRRYRLPENANVDEASAVYKNGVLTVTVPKEKPVVKSIKIS